MHWLGLLVVIVIAGVIAMVLMQRIFDAQQKLAALHDDLRRNDLKLQSELTRLQNQQRDKPAENAEEIDLAATSAKVKQEAISEEEKP